jgi:hypothetical protein
VEALDVRAFPFSSLLVKRAALVWMAIFSDSRSEITMELDGVQSTALVEAEDRQYHPLFSSPDAGLSFK